ncbi:MAG: type III-A CRISPR-associated RAMP protein Csm3 [Patescibacteria group bacterium]|nr:MAG: type III-A CRISPR-associated RAMP protein Csm3 [Patescibacteria group bacterium]
MDKVVKTTYKIKVLTGLHIGAGKEGFEIGEMDNPIVKEFDSGIPYIPGSSIKGKMRFLLEKKYKGDQEKSLMVEELFGQSAEVDNKKMTIVLIRDGFVSEDLRQELWERLKEGEPITEEKTEVSLRGGKSNPRPIERVPKGYEFEFEVVFRFYEVDDEEERKKFIELFEEGLSLLEEDYLGGSGSRGYGKVKIEKNE